MPAVNAVRVLLVLSLQTVLVGAIMTPCARVAGGIPDLGLCHPARTPTLDLSGSSVTTIPAGLFDTFTGLDTLLLSNNQIVSLPAGVFRFVSRRRVWTNPHRV